MIPLVSPTITTKPEDFAVSEGAFASLICSAEGRPRPSITWFKESSTLVEFDNSVSGANVIVYETGDRKLTSVLIFPAVHSVNFGTYVCLAENELNNATAPAKLIVKGESNCVFNKLSTN